MKLKKLKMPPKAEISTDELDMGPMGDMEGEMAGEGEGEMGEAPEAPEAAPGGDMLADVSDDDLLAELKKRGLMGKLEGEGEGEEESEDEEYMV